MANVDFIFLCHIRIYTSPNFTPCFTNLFACLLSMGLGRVGVKHPDGETGIFEYLSEKIKRYITTLISQIIDSSESSAGLEHHKIKLHSHYHLGIPLLTYTPLPYLFKKPLISNESDCTMSVIIPPLQQYNFLPFFFGKTREKKK